MGCASGRRSYRTRATMRSGPMDSSFIRPDLIGEQPYREPGTHPRRRSARARSAVIATFRPNTAAVSAYAWVSVCEIGLQPRLSRRGMRSECDGRMQTVPYDDAKMPGRSIIAKPMDASPKKPRATYEDVLRAPDTVIAEILEGELFTSPRPRGRHALAHTSLVTLLHPPFFQGRGGPGGWWIILEPELHINDPVDVVVPDLAGWRVGRMAAVPEGVEFRIPPDWVCELLSPSTERSDRTRKLRIYARAGVRHVWLVNAPERTLEVLRLDEGRWTLLDVHADQDAVRAEPFDAVELDLARLWQDPAPGEAST